MNLREHDDRSDENVWLPEEETERFLAAAENTEQRIAPAHFSRILTQLSTAFGWP